MKIVAIIQARIGSTRLPAKILMDLEGKPVLQHIIERIKGSKVDEIIVATTTNAEDNVVESFCKENSISVFRGNEQNVLMRFYECAKVHGADVIVRVTADDPFKDPNVINEVIDILIDGKYDYASNTINPTFPEGIDIEVFTMKALTKAYHEAVLHSEKEHVTPYIWKNTNIFNCYNLEYAENLSHLRWTLDTPNDFQFVQEIYKRLYNPVKLFYMNDILEVLKKEPQLSEINNGFVRNAGYIKSIVEENLNTQS